MTPLGGHRIDDIRYADEHIECTCGAEVSAPPDHLIHDRHEPLIEAWAAHRRKVGLLVPSFSRAPHKRNWS